MTQVTAIKCPKCGDVIFSRARHDCHSCSCGTISIDGGFDYTRVLFSPGIEPPKPFNLEVEQTREEIYLDWNLSIDKFGVIQEVNHE